MSSFLTQAQINTLTGQMGRMFDTFTLDRTRTITVQKEPIINILDQTAAIAPGYGLDSNINSISYVPVSRQFPARIKFIAEQKSDAIDEIKVTVLDKAKVKITVERDCADYILNNKTEFIELEGLKYNVDTEATITSYLGLKYYVFYLSQIS